MDYNEGTVCRQVQVALPSTSAVTAFEGVAAPSTGLELDCHDGHKFNMA